MEKTSAIIGAVMSFGGASAPDGYSYGVASLSCVEYQELCRVMAPYFVTDGYVKLPDCPQSSGDGWPASMTNGEWQVFRREHPNQTCLFRVR